MQGGKKGGHGVMYMNQVITSSKVAEKAMHFLVRGGAPGNLWVAETNRNGEGVPAHLMQYLSSVILEESNR
jgi:hypothetical protein